jgi:hypothetical protein
MSTTALESELVALWKTPKAVRGWFAKANHKGLGIRYRVTAFAFRMIGGFNTLLSQLRRAQPKAGQLAPELSNQIFAVTDRTSLPYVVGILWIALSPLFLHWRAR